MTVSTKILSEPRIKYSHKIHVGVVGTFIEGLFGIAIEPIFTITTSA
jgi:hypothetical protein